MAKKITTWFLFFLAMPILYLIASLILSSITIAKKNTTTASNKTIYLNTNGIHLDIILPKKDISAALAKDLIYLKNENYISFGWGDENFYINTPTWNELTFTNAFKAMFLKSTTLMHVTRYKTAQNDWIKIKINDIEFERLNKYLLHSFSQNNIGNKILLKNKGYSKTDNFYKAKGSYSCFNTCNSWVNAGLKTVN